jgi:2'-hydroxyisoflavone reductase
MNILVIGGTMFLGRHIVESALAREHRVTLFNRGQHGTELFPDVEKLRGDRNLDVCGYTPQQMRLIAEALGANVPHYIFVSSISAYGSRPPNEIHDETAALAEGDKGYGEEKARSEESIAAAYPDRVAIVRPGLIVGPHDPTGRFIYWPTRVARGGNVLAPGRPERAIQWIDVRDLANWIVRLAENKTAGAFNAITPAMKCTMADLLAACVRVANVDVTLNWMSDIELTNANVAFWTELPLWIPEDEPDAGGLMLAKADRAMGAGLTFRSVDDTVRDTLAWAKSLPENHPALGIEKTLSAEREAELLRQFNVAQ